MLPAVPLDSNPCSRHQRGQLAQNNLTIGTWCHWVATRRQLTIPAIHLQMWNVSNSLNHDFKVLKSQIDLHVWWVSACCVPGYQCVSNLYSSDQSSDQISNSVRSCTDRTFVDDAFPWILSQDSAFFVLPFHSPTPIRFIRWLFQDLTRYL